MLFQRSQKLALKKREQLRKLFSFTELPRYIPTVEYSRIQTRWFLGKYWNLTLVVSRLFESMQAINKYKINIILTSRLKKLGKVYSWRLQRSPYVVILIRMLQYLFLFLYNHIRINLLWWSKNKKTNIFNIKPLKTV